MATTMVAWHRITSPGCNESCHPAGTSSSSRARDTSCNSSSRTRWRATSSTSSAKSDENMHVRRLTAVDAQTYWLSAKMPNDLLLMYGFDGTPTDLDVAIEKIRCRADGCGELRLRVRDGHALTYPEWASVDVDARQFTVHHLDDNSWT